MVATEQTGQRGIFKVWSLLSLFAPSGALGRLRASIEEVGGHKSVTVV